GNTLAVASLDGRKPPRVLSETSRPLSAPFWSADGRRALYSQEAPPKLPPTVPAVQASLSSDSGTGVPAGPTLPWPRPFGSTIVSVDVATGEKLPLVTLDALDFRRSVRAPQADRVAFQPM